MATLEVHDGKGRVEYVTISRSHPALIGSDPKCDVVVKDPAVLGFHGRMRWKGDRFKVEAFPEARSLDVNGKKVVSTSFRQGDELAIGNVRVFLVDDTDSDGAGVAPQKASVQGNGGGGGWLGEAEPAAAAPASKTARPPVQPDPPLPAVHVPWWKRTLRSINAGGAPPGQENIASSPLVLGLAVALCSLLLVGYGLWSVISKNRADREYQTANQMFADRDYTNAEKAFDEFLETNPRDTRVGRARVLRALSKVRQFSSAGGQSWTSVMINARQMIKTVGKEPYYRERRMDLAEEILK
ncbi:MAG TPA: FHA domain-containing protein, partial [Isosphaeraceae bacterium]|nr:FHA domain-containing protein [Isosphaeraceae bacterium]